MAKHNCAICGAETGLMSGQKLADGNYICRKNCRAKGFSEFDFVSATLDTVKAHLSQVERGTKIWNEVFEPRMKTKDKDEKLHWFGTTGGDDLYVSESTGTAVGEVQIHDVRQNRLRLRVQNSRSRRLRA